MEGNFILKHATYIQEFADVYVSFARSSKENIRDYELEQEEIEGVKISKVYYKKSELPVVSKFVQLKRYIKAMEMATSSHKVEFDFAVVNVAFQAGLFALHLKKKNNLPFVILEHWSGYLPATSLFINEHSIIKRYHRKIYKEAQQVFAVSTSLGDALKELDLVKEYGVIPNYIDVDLFQPSSAKFEQFTFVHISTADEETKNLSGILRALQALKKEGHSFKLKLIVEAEKEGVLQKIVSYGLENHVDLYSYLPSEHVAEILRKSHCLIQFSNFETFSIVLAEAWMSGVPTIYSKCGGLTNTLNSTLGIQIQPKDESALLGALNTVFENYYQYSAEEIRQEAEKNFHPTRIKGQILSINYPVKRIRNSF